MTMHDDYALVGRTLLDSDFRARLFADVEGTIAAERLSVSPTLVAQVRTIDRRVADQVSHVVGAAFGPSTELGDGQLEGVAGGLVRERAPTGWSWPHPW